MANTTISAVNTFPSCILANIFHRLSVKSLALCCCVCKTWQSVIKSPNFLSSHLTTSLNTSLTLTSSSPNPPVLLLRRCPRSAEELYTLHGVLTTTVAKNDYFPLLRTISPPPLAAHPGNRFLRIAASCAGLVLLVDDLLHFTHTFFLWNPTTRRILSLPDPPFIRESTDQDIVKVIGSDGEEEDYYVYEDEPCKGYFPDRFESCLGLAYDATTNDFKVLRVIMMVWRDDEPVTAELYSVKSGSWRTLKCPKTRYNLSNPRGPMAFCNGYLHYATYTTETSHSQGPTGKQTNSIMALHVLGEQFRKIRFPAELIQRTSQANTIFPYTGTAVSSSSSSPTSIALFHLIDMTKWELWVMSTYGVPDSWVRMAKYDKVTISNPLSVFPGLLLGGELFGEVAGIEIIHGKKRTVTREVEFEGLRGKSIIYDEVDGNNRMAEPTCGAVHVESLALLGDDVGDKERLVVYKDGDKPTVPPMPTPETFSTAEEIDWDICYLCEKLMTSQFNLDNGEFFRLGKW